jgi:RHS repeat-associated protein
MFVQRIRIAAAVLLGGFAWAMASTSAAAPPVKNEPPVVSLTSPATGASFGEPATITLSATASDSDGSVSEVAFFSGNKLIATVTTAPYTFEWTGVAAGRYRISARATDNAGDTTKSSVARIIVGAAPPNSPPAVSLTSPTSGASFTAPAAITLSADASDSDGIVSQVAFFQGNTLIATVTAEPYTFNWTNVAAGSYGITARATDDDGAVTTSSAANITVTSPANQPPAVSLTSPANGASFTAPASVALAASASDPDGTVGKVEFFRGTTLIATATAAPYTFNWTNVAAGSYSITAKATDNAGAVTTSNAASITVTTPANQPPAVSLTSPANGASFTAPANVALASSASDPDGIVSKVEFFRGTTLIATVTAAPYTFNWTNVAAGSYSITAKATDNSGAVTTSNAASITVTSPANQPPAVSLTSPANGASFTAPANIALAASASDPDGTVTKVEFFRGTTLIATVTAAPYTFNWTNVAAGSYSITAKATDNAGAVTTSNAASITVTTPSNQPPAVSLTSPANGASFTAPATIALAATASDADGTVSKVEFFRGTTLIATVTAAPYSFNWTNVAAGSYSITARATDNAGAVTTSNAASITVTSAANQPPAVSLTSPANGASFTAPASIALAASASDPDGTVSKVEFFRGTTLIATVTAAPYTFNWTNVAAGSYSITARATDNAGAVTTSNAASISVGASSGAITITSPAAGSHVSGQMVDVVGSFTGPLDTTVLVYNGINSTVLATLTSATTYRAQFVPLAQGDNTLTATTIGRDGAFSSTSVAVHVPQRLVVLTSPTSGASYEVPPSLTFQASALVSTGSIQRVDYYRTFVGKIGSATTPPYTFVWNNPPPGSYNLFAQLVDGQGLTSQSNEISITINGINQTPTVSLTAPTNGAVYSQPANITLQATAADSDGTIAQVAFLQNGALLGTTNVAPYSLALTNLSAGGYSFTAQATDNRGGVVTSAPVSVTVTPPNLAPTVTLTSPQTTGTYTAPGNIPLAATVADSDGSVSKVEYYAGNTLVATATTAPFTTTWAVELGGTHVMTARAFDNLGASTVSGSVTISITDGVTYLHHDFAGNVIGATDTNGAVLWKEDYQPYGERMVNAAAAAGNRQFFTGKPLDADTGLSYMGARYYDPAMGRFMGIDAVGFDEASVHSFNRYGYANNNPYKFVDPDGNSPLTIFAVEVAKQTGIGYGLGVAADSISQYAAWGTVDLGMAATSDAAIAGGATGLFSGAVAGAVKGVAAANLATARAAAVDAANAGQAAGRTNGTAAGFAKGEQVVSAQSGAPGANHPVVQKALDNVKKKSDFHGACGEIGCLNQVLNAGGNPSGGSMAAARIRAPGKAAHGTPKEACSTCADVMKQLGVNH